jgi:hypothetical protein
LTFGNVAGLYAWVNHGKDASGEAPIINSNSNSNSNSNNRRKTSQQTRLANNSIDEHRPNLADGDCFSVASSS